MLVVSKYQHFVPAAWRSGGFNYICCGVITFKFALNCLQGTADIAPNRPLYAMWGRTVRIGLEKRKKILLFFEKKSLFSKKWILYFKKVYLCKKYKLTQFFNKLIKLYVMLSGKCDTTGYNAIKFLKKTRNIFVFGRHLFIVSPCVVKIPCYYSDAGRTERKLLVLFCNVFWKREFG